MYEAYSENLTICVLLLFEECFYSTPVPLHTSSWVLLLTSTLFLLSFQNSTLFKYSKMRDETLLQILDHPRDADCQKRSSSLCFTSFPSITNNSANLTTLLLIFQSLTFVLIRSFPVLPYPSLSLLCTFPIGSRMSNRFPASFAAPTFMSKRFIFRSIS